MALAGPYQSVWLCANHKLPEEAACRQGGCRLSTATVAEMREGS